MTPTDVSAELNQSEAAYRAGNFSVAEAGFRKVLQIQPDKFHAARRLGNICDRNKDHAVAEAYYRQALAVQPDSLATLYDLAVCLWRQAKPDEACEIFEKLARLAPATAAVWKNLAGIRLKIGQARGAIGALQRYLALAPAAAAAHRQLANLLRDQRSYLDAASHYREAIRTGGQDADLYNNLGFVLNEMGQVSEAVRCFQEATRLNPCAAGAYGNLANVLVLQGRLADGRRVYRQAMEIDLQYPGLASNLLLSLNYDPSLQAAEVFEQHRSWGQAVEASASPPDHHANDREPERPLRVGYVSADFRRHAAMMFFEPVLANHDRRLIEVFCYAESPDGDDVTERLKSLATGWRPTGGIKDEEVAEQVRRDRIDILVDLAGHMADNRLGVFALKPAPVQITYLGYPNTTGLTRIDYRITDDLADPPGKTESYHTERLLRLPGGFLTWQPPREAPLVAQLPCQAKGFVTVGCFNYNAKVTDQCVALWAEILHRVPASRLLLKSLPLGDAEYRQLLLDRLARLAIPPERVELRGYTKTYGGHMDAYNSVDVALDCFPYNGTTTTCEALWMGVPVVTLAGAVHASRVGASLLTLAGMKDLIAETPDRYVAIAASLAGERGRLEDLRTGMRPRMGRSVLLDSSGFTRRLEAAFRQVWRRWCDS